MDYRKRSSLPTNTLSREARFHESWICCSLAHTHQFVMATSISMLLPRLRLFSASRTWHDELALNIKKSKDQHDANKQKAGVPRRKPAEVDRCSSLSAPKKFFYEAFTGAAPCRRWQACATQAEHDHRLAQYRRSMSRTVDTGLARPWAIRRGWSARTLDTSQLGSEK